MWNCLRRQGGDTQQGSGGISVKLWIFAGQSKSDYLGGGRRLMMAFSDGWVSWVQMNRRSWERSFTTSACARGGATRGRRRVPDQTELCVGAEGFLRVLNPGPSAISGSKGRRRPERAT